MIEPFAERSLEDTVHDPEMRKHENIVSKNKPRTKPTQKKIVDAGVERSQDLFCKFHQIKKRHATGGAKPCKTETLFQSAA